MAAGSIPSILKSQKIFGAISKEHHRRWAEILWSRMDRDSSNDLTIDELNCDEFMEVFRGILSPQTAKAKVRASYGRAEINAPQALRYCVNLADKDGNGSLDFEEFEKFLRFLRRRKTPKELTDLTFALFDVDSDGHIGELEFRDIWRYFNGKSPQADEFQANWTRMDTQRQGRVTRPQYAKWLAKSPPAFRSQAPPVGDEAEPASEPSTPRSVDPKISKEVFKPAPGLWHKPQMTREHWHEWNPNFAAQDISENNIARGGNLRHKTMFSRPASLPELKRFYATYQGFQDHKRRHKMKMPPPPKLIESHDSIESLMQPLLERHSQWTKNSEGKLIEWKQNTPRALQKRVWQPGSLTLRVPGPPAPYLVKGREAPDPVW